MQQLTVKMLYNVDESASQDLAITANKEKLAPTTLSRLSGIQLSLENYGVT